MVKFLGDNTWGIERNDMIVVQAKIFYHSKLPIGNGLFKTGMIGEFKCDVGTSLEDSFLLFEKLFFELKSLGAKTVIGPIDGSTWQNYRLTTYYGDDKQFLLEPFTPEHYIKHWLNAGFVPDKEYSSYITSVNEWNDSRLDKLNNKFSTLEFLELEEKHLSDIFDLSIKSFTKNPYYIPIEKDVYLNKYSKMIALLKPNTSLVVYDKSQLVGYVFSTLDFDPKNPNNKPERLILKTIAIEEDRKYAGLGTYLLSKLVDKSKEFGVIEIIYALMYDSNSVQNIIKDNSKKMRGYTLYKKDTI